ncbi:membrane protein insertase, YidC/Oxa1 family [Pseudoxanthomonas suwonensis 11-1]|uniref:Membrane protein insertase YidC n=1 Tax=Pseudoxanthomonas suwonensis (strain 11-1) TaxID=743721 RepID=E6WXG3_PSEUU|nr:membrane protein insertase YidC [Pseudoxanthomonas suwonensis]ADV28932.1 membrane protein insertase, YidC/Oxa1 family [Pseudoxanthomonas suwonensis 11-1]
MNQTRVFLILAWLMVAVLLWMEWGKEQAAPAAAAPAPTTAVAQDAIPQPVAAAPAADGSVPAAAAAALPAAQAEAAPAAASAQRIVASSDVLQLVLDGGSVVQADLLQFPRDRNGDGTAVRLFDTAPASFYAAQSGWVSASGAAPTHLSGFVPAEPQREYVLAEGADSVEVPFVWQGDNGVQIRRTYVLSRGAYAVTVRDEVVNAGSAPWQGQVYRQLVRKPPVIERGYTSPESFSFNGAAWYDGSYDRRKFDEDYIEDGKLNLQTSNGWVAMLQHHFFTAWLPAGTQQAGTISLDQVGDRALVREVANPLVVAPGSTATSEARLYVGPKLVSEIRAQGVPGLERAVDYSQFTILAVLGEGLFWVLSHMYDLFGNWGWAIIGLVVVVKALMYPLSAAQYKSFAKMRKFQPRIQQLKERYGEDRQKFQMAMMELYKKEKINPMGGCLPILVQMPVFLALYWVLVESVELRHAPWILWIQDLTARDPFFILPVINVAVMWFTQKLQPAPGMDPMQQKMMQFMPLVFGVMMAFFPAGLVLYWVTNGALGLLQQWWMMKRHGEPAPKPAAK